MSECPSAEALARREHHSRPIPGGRGHWWTDRLWDLASALTPSEVAISDIPEFDLDCWFSPASPATIRSVAAHARRIHDADLSYPVILAADGGLMDGGHRLAQAWMSGRTHVLAVRFVETPEPDWTT